MLDFYTIQVTPFQQDCRLLVHQETSDAIVVDPGGDVHYIVSAIESTGANLKAILLTHGHIDHIGGVAGLLEHYPGVKVIGPHKDEQPLIANLKHQAASFGVSYTGEVTPDEYVEDGQVLQLFPDASFKVFHTPGHTPGGVCYYCAEENFVLVGDTLFPGSIGRTDFEGGNYADLIDSIKNKLYTLPDITEVCCGHMGETSIGEEKANNPFTM